MCYLPITSYLFDVPLKLDKKTQLGLCSVVYCSQTFMLTVGYTRHHTLHARMPERKHYRTHKRTRTRTRTLTHTHSHTPVHMHTCPHTDTQTHTHTSSHLHTCTHTHTDAHTDTLEPTRMFVILTPFFSSNGLDTCYLLQVLFYLILSLFFLCMHNIEIFLISYIFCFYSVLQISTNVVILVV